MPKRAGRVVRGRDDAAAVRVAADDERHARELGALELLHGGEERVEVEVRDDQRHGTRVVPLVRRAERTEKEGRWRDENRTVMRNSRRLGESASSSSRASPVTRGARQRGAAEGPGREAPRPTRRRRRADRGAREAGRGAGEGEAGATTTRARKPRQRRRPPSLPSHRRLRSLRRSRPPPTSSVRRRRRRARVTAPSGIPGTTCPCRGCSGREISRAP